MKQILLETVGAGRRSLHQTASRRLQINAALILGIVYSLAIGGYYVAVPYLALGRGAVLCAACLLFGIFALVLRGLAHHPYQEFGAANTVTAIRTALVALIGAAVLVTPDLATHTGALWTLVGLIIAALLLDGLDGYLARSRARESALGARFDMEVDALLVFILSGAAVLFDKAGWWVLAIGLMRYGFVAAQVFLPDLKRPLPPSMRRKAVCVVQGGALCFILMPVITPPVSHWIAAVALVLLIHSFAVDTVHLLRQGRSAAIVGKGYR